MDYAPARSDPNDSALNHPTSSHPTSTRVTSNPATSNSGNLNASVPGKDQSEGLIALKILVAGGFGAGKTTLVGSLSEIPPLSTEERMTELSVGIDADTASIGAKTTTTVAMDFGRITVEDQLILYLFGTPGQDRFWFMWDELARGAVGGLVIVDLRRIDDCFPAIDFFEDRRLPFAVAVNNFPGTPVVDDDEVRDSLAIAPQRPLVRMSAKDPRSSLNTLIAVVQHAITA